MQVQKLIDYQNQLNDEFRLVKTLLFLLASANNETLPTGTANEVAHLLVNRVEDIESKFDVLCEEVKYEINKPLLED